MESNGTRPEVVGTGRLVGSLLGVGCWSLSLQCSVSYMLSGIVVVVIADRVKM